MRMLLTRVCFYLNCTMKNVSQGIRLRISGWFLSYLKNYVFNARFVILWNFEFFEKRTW